MLQISLAGRLGRDAQLRRIQSGEKVLSFSVAVSVYKDKTEWVDCSLWGDRAEKLEKHLIKGTALAVTGEASPKMYEANGETRCSIACRVDKLTLLGGPKREDDSPVYDRTPAGRDDSSEIPF